MPTFQRARTDDQRAERAAAIVGAARAMLAEMPLTAISLNALARRAGLATSNVLRYFESREAILLELVHAESVTWLDDLATRLVVRPDADVRARAAATAEAFAASAAAHPDFCELISAQAPVLEQRLSPDAAAAFKRASQADLQRLCDLLTGALPELTTGVPRLAAHITLLTGALWAQSRADRAAGFGHDDFPDGLRDTVLTMLIGAVTRATK